MLSSFIPSKHEGRLNSVLGSRGFSCLPVAKKINKSLFPARQPAHQAREL